MHEEQSADDGQFAGEVVADNRDAPGGFVARHGFDQRRDVFVQFLGERGMVLDFGGRKYLAIGGVHARDVLPDERGRFVGHGFVPYLTQVDGANGAAVFLAAGQESLAIGKAEAAGKQGDGARFGGQGIGLPVVHHLQVVFDGAQEDIAVGENAGVGGGKQPGGAQARQGFERGAGANLRILADIGQLQVLDDEFDIADGAGAELDFAPGAAFFAQEFLGALFHGIDFGANLLGRQAKDARPGGFAQFFTERQVARDGSKFEQGLFFPGAGVLFEIFQVPGQGGDERAVLAPGPQAHIDPVQESLRSGCRQDFNQFLGKGGVIKRVVARYE